MTTLLVAATALLLFAGWRASLRYPSKPSTPAVRQPIPPAPQVWVVPIPPQPKPGLSRPVRTHRDVWRQRFVLNDETGWGAGVSVGGASPLPNSPRVRPAVCTPCGWLPDQAAVWS